MEVARGDLLGVVPASDGVHNQVFHFWDSLGRSDWETMGWGWEGHDEFL